MKLKKLCRFLELKQNLRIVDGFLLYQGVMENIPAKYMNKKVESIVVEQFGLEISIMRGLERSDLYG